MLQNNDATELCITKGQEGTVAGWQSCVGLHGKLVLDTVFVQLTNPPRTIKSDQIKKVEREQVCLLPNFSMTDYGSQGMTRVYNPVDLQHSSTHQSY